MCFVFLISFNALTFVAKTWLLTWCVKFWPSSSRLEPTSLCKDPLYTIEYIEATLFSWRVLIYFSCFLVWFPGCKNEMFIQRNSLCLVLKYKWIKHVKSSLRSVLTDLLCKTCKMQTRRYPRSSRSILLRYCFNQFFLMRWPIGSLIKGLSYGWTAGSLAGDLPFWHLQIAAMLQSHRSLHSNEKSLNTKWHNWKSWNIVVPRQHVVHEAGDWEELRGASFGFPVLQDCTMFMW